MIHLKRLILGLIIVFCVVAFAFVVFALIDLAFKTIHLDLTPVQILWVVLVVGASLAVSYSVGWAIDSERKNMKHTDDE